MTSKKTAKSIGVDFLLIYKLDGSGLDDRVIFVRTGTQAELFE
jgi:mRNA-degrading endonuclease YafQ of YafQ-DinJ toxin-antitoxin module